MSQYYNHTYSFFFIKMSWLTLSNAFDKSHKVSREIFLSMLSKISFTILVNAVTVDNPGLEPCCVLMNKFLDSRKLTNCSGIIFSRIFDKLDNEEMNL